MSGRWLHVKNDGQSNVSMYLKPSFLPLHGDDIIYVLRDEHGKLISAGTRDVCELLLQMFNNEGANRGKDDTFRLLDEEFVTSPI